MRSRLIYIDSLAKLKLAQKDIDTAPIICVDTEYDSLRYFKEKLCLIQIATDKKIYFCDPLIRYDISFLATAFANPSQVKVFHAAENDIRLLKREYGFSFENIFDTQRVALMLGCNAPSLLRLIEKFLGIKIEKSKAIQRSRWDKRPLDDEQLIYAAGDVYHLKKLYKKLDEIILQKGLQQEAQKVFNTVAQIKWHGRKIDLLGHKKIAGFEQLNSLQQRRLQSLYYWRFHKAKLLDRAVHRVMSDKELFSLVDSVL